MKSYFAKYLPVEGEIKEGDYYVSDRGDIFRNKYGTRPYKGDKKVKLFLCSRDIQVGDKFHVDYTTTGHTDEQECIATDRETIYSQGINDDLYNPRERCWKIIGEISPEATWVREGDEFKLRDFNPLAAAAIEHKRFPVPLIRILGPCKHYH